MSAFAGKPEKKMPDTADSRLECSPEKGLSDHGRFATTNCRIEKSGWKRKLIAGHGLVGTAWASTVWSNRIATENANAGIAIIRSRCRLLRKETLPFKPRLSIYPVWCSTVMCSNP